MNAFILFLIGSVTSSAYLVQAGWLPKVAKYLPEVFSAIALVMVIIMGVRDRFRHVRPAYWFAFIAIAIVMVCGVLANAVESGPLFAGIRTYLRAAPLFFLAVVYPFSDAQLRTQLKFLLVFCLLQFPIALAQRLNELSWGNASGDKVVGMLRLSGILSVFLICAACVVTAYFLRKRINLLWFILLFVGVLAATTINETKSSLIFVPLGVLAVFFFASRSKARVKNSLLAVVVLSIFGAIFIPVYDHFMGLREHGISLSEFFGGEKTLDTYMSKQARIGATNLQEVGRTDAIVVPLREMAKDPTHLAFGVGIGNASRSALGYQFDGAHYYKFGPFLKTGATYFILELGLFGLLLILAINYMIFRDSVAVAASDDSTAGILAAGWVGVTAIVTLATFYVDVTSSEAISYLFWYFSGIVAARRVALSQPVR